MRSELVPTEGRRGNRFRRYTNPVERDESDDDSESRPVRNYQQIASSCVTFAPIPPESDSEDEHLWPVPKPEMEEVLDPETGMMINLLNEEKIEDTKKDKDQCFLDPQTGVLINPLSNDIIESKKVITLDPANQYVDDEHIRYGMKEPHKTSIVLSNPELQVLKRRKTYSTDENLILNYVHKKFRVTTIKTEMLDANIIQEANLRHRHVLSR